MKTSDIIFRDDLYPRFEPNQQAIQRYCNSINYLPPICVDQNNILIDGFHRWKAHQMAGIEEIDVEVIGVESEKELKKLAYELNSKHGLQLSDAEKRKFAIDYIAEYSIEEISDIISVPKETIRDWTKTTRDEIKQERNRLILESYLRAWNTQQSIAETFEITQKTVANVVDDFSKNSEIAKITKEFKPYLYNIWKKLEGNDTEHFGSFPEVYMENLLYYHTGPLDIIYDPFAGNGTTVDVCKKWMRRYYCTDFIVKPGREKDIREHDIVNGLPDDLQKPDLVFLDPPYWKQAEGKYSKVANDLGNMDLNDFNESIRSLLTIIAKKKIRRIAIVIQPTQYKNSFVWADHIFDFHEMLSNKYAIEMRYILPYSTQQYNAQMVETAKEKMKGLCLNRDLVVWELR